MNTPVTELFFKAILCNWLVCLAFFVPMAQKGDGAKMFSMMLFVLYPIAAITFGGAIILIVYGGGDLFTGNTFYYTLAALRKKMRWPTVIKLWMFSYAGNLMGAVFFAGLILMVVENMESKSLVLVEELALKKQSIFVQSPLRYLLRAMLASMFIGFGVIVAFKTGNLFYVEHSPFTSSSR
ncbi:hypothetical protein DT075_02500 [Bacillus licheniformis]|nr:hypothetical protein DT075_02500 [Bacillus licheniformis]